MSIFHSQIFIIFLIIVSIYILIYIVSKIECKLYKISNFNISTDKTSDKIKIVYLSDFHDKKYTNDNIKLIDDIISVNPDYIVMGGDFIDFSTIQSKLNKSKTKNAIKFIEKLAKKVNEKLGTSNCNLNRIFFGFGNHELRLRTRFDNAKLKSLYDEFVDCLNKNKINILDNNSFEIAEGIKMYGLSLYDGYYTNMLSSNIVHNHVDNSILDEHFNDISHNNYNIMVFHKPDYCEDFFNYGFDLVLSGHNHGGLIKFPIIGCLFSPDLKLFPKYYDGLYNVNNHHLVVSSGIGEHFVKIRVNNRPEFCVININ